MSFCRQEGKDKIIFVTKEDHEKPSTVQLPELDDDQPGLILPSGEINWNCPCLGGMATGPCGVEFREAFSCFHYSTADPKGSNCYEQFKSMQDCMIQYPTLYPTKDDDEVASSEEASKLLDGHKSEIAAAPKEENGSGDHKVSSARSIEKSIRSDKN